MAYTSISALFKGICDAIRSKDGTSAQIPHQSIPERILSLPTGGGSFSLQSKTITPTEVDQNVVSDYGYDGLSNVYVNGISPYYIGSYVQRKQAQTYTPGTSDQTIDSGQYLDGNQTIKGDTNLKASNIKNGVKIFNTTGTYAGEAVSLQEKTVTPTKSVQTVTPDSGKTGLSKVTVDAIPSQYIVPSGTKNVTENGTIDVSSYASVNVNVPTGGSKPQEYNGSFTTDWYGEANVNLGFKPDFITIPLGVYKDPGFPDEEYNLCIDCKAAKTTGERLVTQGYLFDGTGILKLSVIPNANGFWALIEKLDWSLSVSPSYNTNYNFVAKKYE